MGLTTIFTYMRVKRSVNCKTICKPTLAYMRAKRFLQRLGQSFNVCQKGGYIKKIKLLPK